jgi:murein DD-endopeptidase MepM/ murein hydrolase activator NlpD
MKMNFKEKIKQFTRFSILIVPTTVSSSAKSKTISAHKFYLLLLLTVILICVILSASFIFTPLNKVLPRIEDPTSYSYKIKTLDERIYFLLDEVNQLKLANERLKRAIILGDSTIKFKPSSQNSINKNNFNFQLVSGNLWEVVKNFLNTHIQNADNSFFIKPVNGYISQEFNPESGHFGIDYAVNVGTPIYASANGYVIFSDFTVNEGYMIILVHNEGYVTVYKHCSSLIKSVREVVVQGEVIALSGNTGKLSSGPHLHFEIWKDGQVLNPKSLIIN